MPCVSPLLLLLSRSWHWQQQSAKEAHGEMETIKQGVTLSSHCHYLSNYLSAESACSNFPSGLDLTACWWCQWPGWPGWVQCSQCLGCPGPGYVVTTPASQLLPPATNTTTSRSGQQRRNLQHSACALSQVFIVFRYSIVLLIPLIVFLIFYP